MSQSHKIYWGVNILFHRTIDRYNIYVELNCMHVHRLKPSILFEDKL
jgi:hypothetical protein